MMRSPTKTRSPTDDDRAKRRALTEQWFKDRWGLLASLEADAGRLAGLYGMGECLAQGVCGDACGGSDHANTGPLPVLGFRGWPDCPIALLRGRQWQTIVRLFNAAKLSPIADWPLSFEAWKVDGLEALRLKIKDREHRDQDTAFKRGRKGKGTLSYPGRRTRGRF